MFCRNCGNKLNDNDKFCAKCGTKLERKTSINIENNSNNQLNETVNNNANSENVNKLIKILGICAATSFLLAIVVWILGVFMCFPDPLSDTNNNLSYDLFGNVGAIMYIISNVLLVLIIILTITKSVKRKGGKK